jgi:hypothetical protein
MTPVRLLILAVALAVLAKARVPLLPGWVVPVPAVLLVVMAGAVASVAAMMVLRFRPYRPVVLPAPAAVPAGPAEAGR